MSIFAAPVRPGPAADPVGAVTAAAFEKFAFPTPDRTDWADRRPEEYADPSTRQYPVHSAEASAASAVAYHYLCGPADHPVAGRIKLACEAWGLDGLWDALSVKSSPPPSRYALPGLKKYPIDTPENVKAASVYLGEYGDRFGGDVKREFAKNLLSAATELGCLSPSEKSAVEVSAGLGRPSDLDEVFGCRKRAAYMSGRNDLLVALESAEAAIKAGADAYEAAALVKQADAACNWRFGDPCKGLTGLSPTNAMEAIENLVVAKSGNVYRREDLSLVSKELSSPWGLGAVSTISKKASLLAEDEAFEEIVKASGVDPIGTAVPTDRIDWDSLAD